MKFIAQHPDGTLYTIPDTAIHINRRPFYIPPYAEPCFCQIAAAIRIGRLGRNIGERWAHRYYDRATLVAHKYTPSLPPSQGCCFDEAVSIGEWQETESVLSPEQKAKADHMIAEASKYFMLRQGDILLIDNCEDPFVLNIGDRIERAPYLAFDIK